MDKKTSPYPYSADIAGQNGDTALYNESLNKNKSCAEMIGKVIDNNERLREYNAYDLRTAVNDVIAAFGAERMNWVLANTMQNNDDGRYSRSNMEWAKAFVIPKDRNMFSYDVLRHPVHIDSFVRTAREICSEIHNAQKTDKPSILGQVKENAASIPPADKKDAQNKQNRLEV